VLDRGTWTPGPVFALLADRGRIEQAEMERTFNMGVGMLAVLPGEDVERALAVLTARHVPAWVAGEVKPTKEASPEDGERVCLHGAHPRS
jgi:phosphoribosylformylglycinamidine cyclo-ligase